MSEIISSVLSNRTPDEISLDGDIFVDIKEFYEANPDKPELIYDLLRPHVLDYARRSDEYLITHYSEVKPTSRADANIKLCIYTKYHSLLNTDVLKLFNESRREFGFNCYDNVPIFGKFGNALHIYLRKHLVPEKIQTFTKENFKGLYMLMLLVDLEERDQFDDNAFDLIPIDTANRLREKADYINNYHIGMNILSIIVRAVKSGVSSFTLTRECIKGTEHAENHKIFKDLSREYDINIDYCIEYVKVTINHRNPLIRLRNHA